MLQVIPGEARAKGGSSRDDRGSGARPLAAGAVTGAGQLQQRVRASLDGGSP